MLVEPINNFFNTIYKVINSSNIIKQQVSGVYLSINHDPLYPFILLNLNKATSHNNPIKYLYTIDFDVSIFFRHKEQDLCGFVADELYQLLKPENFSTNLSTCDYKVIGLQKQDISFCKSKDTLTTKLNINYLSCIREK